ncbi:MAG: ComEA family DNA-binding protein [Bacillota bacterium]
MNFGRREQALVLLVAAALIFGLGYKYAQMRSRQALPPVLEAPAAEEKREIAVHVAGAVANPGVYRLPAGARVADAVRKAEPLPDADLNALNLAKVLKDGEKIPVPVKAAVLAAPGSPGASPVAAQGGATGDTRININTADAAELDRLPGIGPALAERIVRYREENGPFASVDDLLNVSGIGEKKLEGLRDYATVN